jgi:hypothetical protein
MVEGEFGGGERVVDFFFFCGFTEKRAGSTHGMGVSCIEKASGKVSPEKSEAA